jgi:hypothetical protein
LNEILKFGAAFSVQREPSFHPGRPSTSTNYSNPETHESSWPSQAFLSMHTVEARLIKIVPLPLPQIRPSARSISLRFVQYGIPSSRSREYRVLVVLPVLSQTQCYPQLPLGQNTSTQCLLSLDLFGSSSPAFHLHAPFPHHFRLSYTPQKARQPLRPLQVSRFSTSALRLKKDKPRVYRNRPGLQKRHIPAWKPLPANPSKSEFIE